MKRFLKWAGMVVGGLVGIIVAAIIVLSIIGGLRVNRQYDVQVTAIAIPNDAVAVARGKHLAEAVTFCHACHGADLSGDVLDDAPLIATIVAPNLTTGRGGVVSSYSDADFVRSIRHGVNPEGRGLMVMHSDVFNNLSAEDLGAIIAYVRSVPPVDREVPASKVGVVGKVLVALGLFDNGALPFLPAEHIDHTAPLAQMPPQGVTVEYGRYLISITLCAMCHGAVLQGGLPVAPGSPPGPNIAVYGTMGAWTVDDFAKPLRTGVMPDGSRSLNPEWMPWDVYANLTDDEVQAMWLYIQSLSG